jgi:hypothetical protein
MKAKQRNRPVDDGDLTLLRAGINALSNARQCFRAAGSGNAANYVARALKSAHGALRNAEGKYLRALREDR